MADAYFYENFFYARLTQLRNAKGVSARDMSLTLGQSVNYINMIENRRAFPSMTTFFYICDYLGVTPQEFFDQGTENPSHMREMIEDLKRLDAKKLILLSGIIKELGARPDKPEISEKPEKKAK